MVSDDKITTIKLDRGTKLRLDKLKTSKKESYDEVLQKILQILNICKSDPFEAKQRLHDIDKIKFLRLEENDEIDLEEQATIINSLNKEGYEEAIVIKGPKRNLLVYIRENKGIFMMGTESGETYVLDVAGTIPVNKILSLQHKIETLTKNASFLDSFTDN